MLNQLQQVHVKPCYGFESSHFNDKDNLMHTRTEHDSMGEMQVPATALYQAQTQRAVLNFAIRPEPMAAGFIRALLLIKQAAATANQQLGLLPDNIAASIVSAATSQLNQLDLSQFPVPLYQTGSGTSSNMNVNEVLASLATKQLAEKVHPNDHVNLGQSSNDTIPTAISVSTALALRQQLLPALQLLQQTLTQKSKQIGHLVKTGRTHLMDAMPVTFADVLQSWSSQLQHAETLLHEQLPRLQQLPQGGTAVGSGVNAHPDFSKQFCQQLQQMTGVSFQPAPNLFFRIGTQDVSVACSGALKVLAVALMKIANDLRWMNSGPLAGLGEIELPVLQPGSSIMPGKVNPVIPEAVAMAAVQVIGLDTAIGIAGQSGNFELNVMLPLIGQNLLQMIDLLSDSCRELAEKAIRGFVVREDVISQALALNPILVTALNPLIGYEKAAAIAKQAYQQGRPVLDVALEQTEYSREQLGVWLDPATLTKAQSL
jgi:fumarate hydratase, class II